jgi:diguanylate cyclase (GGDEF)-like protein
MGLLNRLDNWTLLVCIALSTSMSAFAFWRTWLTQRRVRGAGTFALAFLCGPISCALFTLAPVSTPFFRLLNFAVGDTLALCLTALLLTGVEQFFGVRRYRTLPWILLALAFPLLLYFTEIHNSLAARGLVMSLYNVIVSSLIGLEMLRHRGRRHLRTIAALMFLHALTSLWSSWATIFRAGPRDWNAWMYQQGPQHVTLVLTFGFFIAMGQLLFLLLTGELAMQLEEEATRDFVTGIMNRRAADRALQLEIDRSQRDGTTLAVALVDVDRFKQINDTQGHAEGDRTLIEVARLIERGLRTYDLVGRFGGDEFLVLLPNTAAPEAVEVMERLRSAVSTSRTIEVTLSIGLTAVDGKETSREVLGRVDAALYEAKEAGRDCIRARLLTERARLLTEDEQPGEVLPSPQAGL